MRRKFELAKSIRRHMSAPEYLLWERLKTRQPGGVAFYRQVAIGPYILDFYCRKARLCIEVDGAQHYEPEQEARDAVRDRYLRQQGIHVHRISVSEIYRDLDSIADGVFDLTFDLLKARWPPPPSSGG